MAKASLKTLLTNTHKGRPTKTRASSQASSGALNSPFGMRGSQVAGADPRLTAAALTKISPTPPGPETYWPYGITGKGGD